MTRSRRDHPRSRGVYSGGAFRRLCWLGSSPLARGLRGARLALGCCGGIIPARAGFTPNRDTPGRITTDHPRSRGVYAFDSANCFDCDGSSPLARGLPRLFSGAGHLPRIIPARAGFTCTAIASPSSARDHPRSRGVYCGDHAADLGGCGSSPLARGLPWNVRLASRSWRIIPARAGFTRDALAEINELADHPRSRGVYIAALSDSDRLLGSSPLARGLRLRIPGIPTTIHATRPRLPSVPT